ncbi:hypothetical protein ACFOGJ_23290 [Marinibaculum pumilum]|uniref:Oxidoreductase n=1 Tax=Marinibaculum pumilum TaxID=1766165 RepID=A0ABV7L6K8_9PROT
MDVRLSHKVLCRLPVVAGVLLLCAGQPLRAESACNLSKPAGPVILTLTGDIACTNAPGRADFDRSMLESLGMRKLTTRTHWHDRAVAFEGPLARDVLAAAGAGGKTARAVALNDYSVEIPLSDFEAYGVLFALKQDGRFMRVRDKGPIWITYPRDQHPELDTKTIRDRWIWQLRTLEVR